MSEADRRIERVFDVLLDRARRTPEQILLASREGDAWVKLSAAEVLARTDAVSAGLLQAGIQKGDRIGLLSTSRPEWNFIDLGAQQIGAVTVALFPKMATASTRHILQESRPALVFLEDAALRDEILPAAEGVVDRERIVLIAGSGSERSWFEDRTEADEEARARIAELRDGVAPEDLATLLYTSGTTGAPKGVQLTHRNLVSNIEACSDLVPVDEDSRALSFLPLSHSFERMLNYVYMHRGVATFYARNLDTIGEDMREVAPHIFTTVPRLLEKVWDRIQARRDELGGIRGRIFDWAVGVADAYELQDRGWMYELQLGLARRLVLSRWHEALGGRVVAVISGGAALSPTLNRRFTAAGIDILEGYGLTETSPVLTVNRYEESGRRFGSVGLPVDDVRVRIAEDGEIRAKGPNVTSGYYRDPEATAEAFDADGWFRTGDLGRIDEDGFLYVQDRKKSLFKTSGGKYVAPAPVESRLTDATLIEHAMLVGENRKMVTALIQPAFGNLRAWCARHGLEADSREEMLELPAVRERFEEIVEAVNADFDDTSRVKRFALVADEWSPASGELTPTMKVRRKIVLERYQDLVDSLYED